MGSSSSDHVADPLGIGRDVVERQALTLGTLDTHTHAGGLGGAHELNVDNIDIVLGSDGLERVDDRLLGLGLDHCGTSIHTKKKRGRNPTSFQLQLHLQANYTNSCENVQAQ